jgi:uncharacterized protein YdaU (DUF1376 family)
MHKTKMIGVRLSESAFSNLAKFSEAKNTNQTDAVRLILDEFFDLKNEDDKFSRLEKRLGDIYKNSEAQTEFISNEIEKSTDFLKSQIAGLIQANQKLAEMLLRIEVQK